MPFVLASVLAFTHRVVASDLSKHHILHLDQADQGFDHHLPLHMQCMPSFASVPMQLNALAARALNGRH